MPRKTTKQINWPHVWSEYMAWAVTKDDLWLMTHGRENQKKVERLVERELRKMEDK